MSAPIQASASVQVVPASNCVKSSTRMPARQPGDIGVTAIAGSLAGVVDPSNKTLFSRCRDLCAAERRDDLLREPVEVFQLHVERRAERRRANHPVDAGIAFLD